MLAVSVDLLHVRYSSVANWRVHAFSALDVLVGLALLAANVLASATSMAIHRALFPIDMLSEVCVAAALFTWYNLANIRYATREVAGGALRDFYRSRSLDLGKHVLWSLTLSQARSHTLPLPPCHPLASVPRSRAHAHT